MPFSKLWRALHDTTISNFKDYLQGIIDILKNLIENKTRHFKLSVIERNELIESLDRINNNFWKDDERWENKLSEKFQKLNWNNKWEHPNKYLKFVIEQYGQLNWDEHGAFNRIKDVIIYKFN